METSRMVLSEGFISLMSECLFLFVILRSNSGKSKAETPKTPTSPSTPTFAPSVCLLAPCYLTGDSVRDKCVEMLSAALKAEGERAWARGGGGKGFPRADEMRSFSGVVQDTAGRCTGRRHCQHHVWLTPVLPKSLLDDYKDYGVNCDKMASEIEDHILELCQGCGCLDCPAAGAPKCKGPRTLKGRGRVLETVPCSASELEFLILANMY